MSIPAPFVTLPPSYVGCSNSPESIIPLHSEGCSFDSNQSATSQSGATIHCNHQFLHSLQSSNDYCAVEHRKRKKASMFLASITPAQASRLPAIANDHANTCAHVYERHTSRNSSNEFADYNLEMLVNVNCSGGLDHFILDEFPKILKRYQEKLPNLCNRFL